MRDVADHSAASYLEAILSGSPMPTFVVDTNSRCTHWNQACEVLFNIPASQMIGTKEMWRAFHGEAHPLLSEFILHGGKSAFEECNQCLIVPSLYAANGFETETFYPKLDKWLVITAAPLVDGEGQLIGAIETIRDVTARKQAENEAIAMRQAAESANIAKSAFLANMSHEIRTPMNAILGFSHILMREKLTPNQSDKLSRIRESTEHLLDVVNNILDISAIEAGKIDIEQIDFDLDALLQSVSTIVGHRAQLKGLEMVVDVDNMPTLLRGDPTRLRQALINYLANAIKFTDHGVIILRAHLVEQSSTDVLIRFEVEDTGIGIDQAIIPRLFTAFEQADTSMSRRFGGNGLGLSITKHFAQLMHGEVGVSSKPGSGSLFWFTARLGKVAQQATSVAPWSEMRALVVDDVRVTQFAHSQLLQRLRVKPQVVDCGAAAIHAIRQAEPPFAMAFIDWHMPDMDGFELLQQIHQLQRTLPCVLVTASADDQVITKGLGAGFVDVLIKPMVMNKLEQCLKRHFSPPTPSAPSLPSVADPCQGKTILLVEDDALSQAIAQDLLEHLGLNVITAENGKEAIEQFERQAFDLIFSDMLMPVMDGLEATQRIRALPGGQQIPIIAMTANAFAHDRARCLEAGMNDFVSKPIDPDLLHRVIRHWLQWRDNPAIGLAPT